MSVLSRLSRLVSGGTRAVVRPTEAVAPPLKLVEVDEGGEWKERRGGLLNVREGERFRMTAAGAVTLIARATSNGKSHIDELGVACGRIECQVEAGDDYVPFTKENRMSVRAAEGKTLLLTVHFGDASISIYNLAEVTVNPTSLSFAGEGEEGEFERAGMRGYVIRQIEDDDDDDAADY